MDVSLTGIFIQLNNSILECILILFVYQYIIGQKDFVFKNKLKSFVFLILYIAFSFYIDYFFKTRISFIIYILFYTFVLGYLSLLGLFDRSLPKFCVRIFCSLTLSDTSPNRVINYQLNSSSIMSLTT